MYAATANIQIHTNLCMSAFRKPLDAATGSLREEKGGGLPCCDRGRPAGVARDAGHRRRRVRRGGHGQPRRLPPPRRRRPPLRPPGACGCGCPPEIWCSDARIGEYGDGGGTVTNRVWRVRSRCASLEQYAPAHVRPGKMRWCAHAQHAPDGPPSGSCLSLALAAGRQRGASPVSPRRSLPVRPTCSKRPHRSAIFAPPYVSIV